MNARFRLALCTLCLSLLPGLASAHEGDPASTAGRLGKVSFPTSCDPKVQPAFERAVAMLHSFWYSAAEKAFAEVLVQDPTCAIANWGYASILMSNPLAGQGASPAGAQKAIAAIEQARRIGAKTQRERDYIEAVGVYYDDWSNRSERGRQTARAEAYGRLAAKYPADDEAQIFYALYLAGTQTQSDQSYSAYLKAASILEDQFKKYPDHPGVAHYLIHSYDAPPIAQKGLPAARRYAGIAPDAPHALHMPSHIFTRVGAWEESAATNRRAMDVAKTGGEPDEAYHGADYMVYAYLQLGRDEDARRTIEEALKVSVSSSTRFAGPYAMAAMPARYVVERGQWKDAAQLPLPPASGFVAASAITRYARALGAARSGDVFAAQVEAEELAGIQRALEARKDTYWATEVEVQRLAAAGWIALAQGNKEDAVKYMRSAADLEDRNEKHIVTPGRLLPARELLGEMLLELNQPKQALVEFETSQLREPNRFRGLYGAAVAAEAAGERAKAAKYYAQLVALTEKGDGKRPEVARAKLALQR
jgi:tetratricopeptide (TPR) repeat protein